ncbi:uncharacterized protein LOC135334805 isoform X2 [Halichondria panicea]|uniref:uncharacterized protein LOC135334805 isoform X2 n=1 Tax=Halichondria panicea TaxID=6063 RepID=UPI00312B2C7E
MATVTLFLCCLLGSVSLVYGQNLIRLALPSDPPTTDRTGQIISFSDFGPGVGTNPPVWHCYNDNNARVSWVFPDGSAVPIVFGRDATGIEMFISGVTGAVVLHRGPTHYSPDGEHCCRRNDNSLRICVTFTPCPTLSPLTNSNGMISYDPDTNIATYGCVPGYAPTITSGTAQRTCESDGTSAGTWTGTPATVTCTIVTCPVLTSPTNGGVSTPSRDYLTFAAYSCDTGYFLTGSATRQCEATGQWSRVAPTCSPVDCRPLAIANGIVDTSSGTTFGSTATYTCNTGYNIVGSEIRTCGASITSGPTGVWSPAAPVCEIVNCGSLDAPSNGAVDTSSGTTFMMTATYTCNTGYTLTGANTRTCGSGGMWSGSDPTCLQLLAVISPSGGPMAGQSFSLTCSLSGGASLQPTLSYQWTREGGSLMTSTATLNFDTLYLSDAGQYSCQVILTSSQLEGGHTVAAHYTIEFMTLNIQLRLDVITNCEVYIESETMAKASGITTRLSQGVEGLCACGFSPSLLTDEFINCFDGSSSHVTYRAVLTGTETASAVELISLIEQWISDTSSIIVQSTRLGLTNTCPVLITDRDSPECPEDITNRTTATTSPTESVVVNVGAVAGWVVAGVLAIVVLVLIILLVLVMLLLLRLRRSGSKDMSDEKTGNQPTQLPPVVMSHLPSHDYEGLSKLQEEATYEVVDQPRPPPPADYQLSACAAYASTDCNTENK